MHAAALDRIDLALSSVALGKDRRRALERRRRAPPRSGARRATRPWLGVAITDAQLIADIAAGYDVVVMGADKWAQVRDPAWYGGDRAARDAALAALPRVLVVPRPGFDVVGAEVLDIDPELAHVSSTRARAGEHHLVAPDARRRLLVDGNNVVGSRPDGWWRDRAGRDPPARRRAPGARGAHRRRTSRSCSTAARSPTSPKASHDGVRVAYARRAGSRRGRRPHRRGGRARRRSRVAHRRHLGPRARATACAPSAREVEGAGALTRELGSGRP